MSDATIDSDPIYNPLDPVTLADPYPVYARLRENWPVYWHAQMQSWVVTRFNDCRTVLGDHRLYARDDRRVGAKIPDDKLSVQQLDPPELVPLRRAFVRSFDAIDLPAIGQGARQCIERTLEQLRGRSSFDLMADLATPVAEYVTCATFGAPTPPPPGKLTEIAFGIALGMDSGLRPEQRRAGSQVSLELDAIVRSWLAAPDSYGFTADVVRNILPVGYPDTLICRTIDAIVNAAYSTVYASIGNAASILLQRPQDRAAINATNLDTACAELMRFDGPAHATSRVATEQTRLGEATIERGQCVITLFAAANRDAAKFERAEELVLDRAPNPHLGFGFGVHQCLGIDLAYTVLREFVTSLLARPALRLAGAGERFPTATLRWLKSLPVAQPTASTAVGGIAFNGGLQGRPFQAPHLT